MSATTTVSSLRVNLSMAISSLKVAEFDAESLKSSAKLRVAFIRGVITFHNSSAGLAANADRCVRTAIERPRDLSASAAADKALMVAAEASATRTMISAIFREVHSLVGTEVGKTGNGDSVNGGHICTMIYGAFGKAAAGALVKSMV